MKHLLTAALLALAALPAYPCIQSFDIKADAPKLDTTVPAGNALIASLTPRSGVVRWRLEKRRLAKNLDRASYQQRNDYAVTLLHLGETEEALRILVGIERTNPGLYTTASNLGTAFELAGRNEHALSWIRAGINRNPRSHEGTEWLHVKILEAKLAMAKDPDWERWNTVVGGYFGPSPFPSLPSKLPRGNMGKQLDAGEVKRAIHYQLKERLQFVQPPDKVVGDLLFTYGNLLFLEKAYDDAEAIYALAIRYDPKPMAMLRLEHVREVRGMAQPPRRANVR